MGRVLDRKDLFKRIKIIIADGDNCMARVLSQNLRAFGFSHIQHVSNGGHALRIMREQPVDLLITEWAMSPMDGPELVRYLRNGADSPNRMLPIIMLTGKGELLDVQTARDCGITEFVVKPFTALALFKRIEQIIDHPRGFVVSPVYVGPDRRRKGKPPEGVADRRVRAPKPAASAAALLSGSASGASIIQPDNALKVAIGFSGALNSIITPAVLEEAQRSIDELHDESLQWIKEDLTALEEGLATLASAPETHVLERMREVALSIKSRAGTFGYVLASDVARQLYLFLCSDYDVSNAAHTTVLRKHIDTIKVIFASGMKGKDKLGNEVLMELQRLIAKNR